MEAYRAHVLSVWQYGVLQRTDIETNETLLKVKVDCQYINGACKARNGVYIAADVPGAVKYLANDADTCTTPYSFPGGSQGTPVRIAYSHASNKLIVGTSSGAVCWFDADENGGLQFLSSDAAFTQSTHACAYLNDSEMFAVGSDCGVGKVYNASTQALVHTLSSTQASGWWSVCNVSSSLMASGHDNSYVCLWSLDDGVLMHAFDVHQRAWIRGLTSVDGIVYSACDDHHVKAFDAQSGQVVGHIDTGRAATRVTLHAGRIYVGVEGVGVSVYDACTFEQVETLETEKGENRGLMIIGADDDEFRQQMLFQLKFVD